MDVAKISIRGWMQTLKNLKPDNREQRSKGENWENWEKLLDHLEIFEKVSCLCDNIITLSWCFNFCKNSL